ncbi:hypothetical protein [Inquilinus limosus]|uniref:hypothetical protein n=1 Tax=Inquilinus limosus TaxID=171674 RepID=UPI00126A4C52|nr:hypothetical protein [Inquilinus limosus]
MLASSATSEFSKDGIVPVAADRIAARSPRPQIQPFAALQIAVEHDEGSPRAQSPGGPELAAIDVAALLDRHRLLLERLLNQDDAADDPGQLEIDRIENLINTLSPESGAAIAARLTIIWRGVAQPGEEFSGPDPLGDVYHGMLWNLLKQIGSMSGL